jgi:hypothetical protein
MNQRNNVPSPLGAGMMPCDAYATTLIGEPWNLSYAERSQAIRQYTAAFKPSFLRTKHIGSLISLAWANEGVLQ